MLDAQQYFDAQLIEARKEINVSGSLERLSATLPGIMEYRFAQLQEVESILELLNIQLKRKRGEKFRYYLEQYNRSLTTRDAEKYADADQDVLDYSEFVNFFAFIRNRYLGITKGLESKGFQINNIVKLRTAGLDDANITFVNIPKS